MKRFWKLIVAGVFFVGGIGCFGSSIGAAIFGLAVGIGFALWWALDYFKKDKNIVNSPISPARADHLNSVAPSQLPQNDYKLPASIDGAPLQYKYVVSVNVTNEPALLSAAQSGNFELAAHSVGTEMHIFSEDNDIGVISDRADMLSDWIRRDDPFRIVLNRFSSEAGLTVLLAFYKDRRKGQERREQTVTPLVSYKGQSTQETISLFLHNGDELEAEQDDEREGIVNVYFDGSFIGKLPAKLSKRFIDNEAYGVFVESADLDDDGEYYVPIVRIYW